MTLRIYEKLKSIVTHLTNQFKLWERETSRGGRPTKIPTVEAVTLALYQHRSTRLTKKSVYEDFKDALSCSYKTLVSRMNKVAVIVLNLILIIMRLGRQYSHLVKYTDSTDIPVCLKKNADSHRTMKGLANWGRSTKGWYFGLKMTMTRDHDGRLLGLKFTSPKANDRDIFRSVNKHIYGIIVADAGYVSKELEQEMNIEGWRWIIIRPYKTMRRIMTRWQEELYRGRFRIEFDFRDLKLFHGLVSSLPRSVNGYLANYLHALLSFAIT